MAVCFEFERDWLPKVFCDAVEHVQDILSHPDSCHAVFQPILDQLKAPGHQAAAITTEMLSDRILAYLLRRPVRIAVSAHCAGTSVVRVTTAQDSTPVILIDPKFIILCSEKHLVRYRLLLVIKLLYGLCHVLTPLLFALSGYPLGASAVPCYLGTVYIDGCAVGDLGLAWEEALLGARMGCAMAPYPYEQPLRVSVKGVTERVIQDLSDASAHAMLQALTDKGQGVDLIALRAMPWMTISMTTASPDHTKAPVTPPTPSGTPQVTPVRSPLPAQHDLDQLLSAEHPQAEQRFSPIVESPPQMPDKQPVVAAVDAVPQPSAQAVVGGAEEAAACLLAAVSAIPVPVPAPVVSEQQADHHTSDQDQPQAKKRKLSDPSEDWPSAARKVIKTLQQHAYLDPRSPSLMTQASSILSMLGTLKDALDHNSLHDVSAFYSALMAEGTAGPGGGGGQQRVLKGKSAVLLQYIQGLCLELLPLADDSSYPAFEQAERELGPLRIGQQIHHRRKRMGVLSAARLQSSTNRLKVCCKFMEQLQQLTEDCQGLVDAKDLQDIKQRLLQGHEAEDPFGNYAEFLAALKRACAGILNCNARSADDAMLTLSKRLDKDLALLTLRLADSINRQKHEKAAAVAIEKKDKDAAMGNSISDSDDSLQSADEQEGDGSQSNKGKSQ